MDFKKSLKDVLVLVIICAVFATVLAAVNSVTAPIIADRLEQAANEAYFSVMEGATGFETVDLSQYTLPKTVKEAKKEKSGMGYAIKLETKGYASGMIIIVGVSNEGVVTGATCIASNETWGLEGGMGDKVVGSDINSIVDVEAGATSLTVNAYRAAVKDAINTATILGGGSVDIRTEEEKFQDALEAALPEGGEEFTKVVLLSVIEGIDSVYEAVNGKGYVCVIGTDSTGIFLGVDADGKAVGEMSAEHKALAEAAIASVKANVAVDVDLTPYMDNSLIANYVSSVKKTGAGSYVIEIKTSGNYTADTPIVIEVVIDAEGKIVNARTISHAETENIGGTQLQDGKFNSNFVDKDEAGAGEVDTVAGVTKTTGAYKNAVLNAFNVVKILGGEEVDTRNEEEKFQDALEAALPGNEQFTKYFKVEIIEGIDSIYVAEGGAGYVCVIGNDSTGIFIGVGADGVAIGEVSDEHKALAEAAVAKIAATELTDIDITEYKDSADRNVKRAFRSIISVQKTATGNYVFEATADGFGTSGEHGASGEKIKFKISISAEGRIIDILAISHGETPSFGGDKLENGYYGDIFIDKDEAESDDVDFDVIKNGATVTSNGLKKSILYCFVGFTTIEGGTN